MSIYELGSPDARTPGGGGWQVDQLIEDNRTTTILKPGGVSLSPVNFNQRKLADLSKEKNLKSNTYTINPGTNIAFDPDAPAEVKRNGEKGRIIVFNTKQGKYHWANEKDIDVQVQEGYQFTYGSTTYWVARGSFDATPTLTSGYVDKTNVPLWTTHSPPTIEHIKQGSLGNCYLLATLASIMLHHPDFPTRMMRDNGDGTVTVKLFDVRPATSPAGFTAHEKHVKVNKSVFEESGVAKYAKDHLWVQMIEKAYAAGGFTGNLLRTPASAAEPKYEDIGSGNEQHAFRTLLGQDATHQALSRVAGDATQKDALFDQIRRALAAGQPITLGTKEYGNLPSHKQARAIRGAGLAGEDILENIVLKHAYTVVDTDEDPFSRYLIVRNPWGGGGGAEVRTGSDGENARGEIRISLGNLTSYFDSITFGPRTVHL